MSKIVLIGGGGHCRACIDVIESTGQYQIVGILDGAFTKGEIISGYSCIGDDNDISEFANLDYQFLVCVGQIYSSTIREKSFSLIKKYNGKLATIISPRAWVAKTAVIGEGTIVMHDVLVNSHAVIGDNCIINTKSLIEHDAVVGDHCHVSTGAIINGGAKVGKSCFIGSAAVLIQSVNIPNAHFIKANSIFTGKK